MESNKRKECLRVLNSGWSFNNISGHIAYVLEQPEEDIKRIIFNSHWNKKVIMSRFNAFVNSYKPMADNCVYKK